MKSRFRNFVLQSAASLFIAFAIWLIAKQSDMDTSWVYGTITLTDVPPNVIAEAQPKEIQLNVQYPRESSNRIVGRTFPIEISAKSFFPGDPKQWGQTGASRTVTYELTAKDLGNKLVAQAQVLAFDPRAVTLGGRPLMRTIPVEVRTTNTLPLNLQLAGPIQCEPAQVTITGTREAIDHAGKALTSAVDLALIANSQQVFPKLILPPGVSLLGADDIPLTVDIAVTENKIRKTVPRVPITYLAFKPGLVAQLTPAQAEVQVEGTAAALEKIGPEDFSFTFSSDLAEMPGVQLQVGIVAHLKASLDPEIASQVQIVNCSPNFIKVEFVSTQPQNKPGGPQ